MPTCAQCQYNLRGSMANSHCPECGWSIAASCADWFLYDGDLWIRMETHVCLPRHCIRTGMAVPAGEPAHCVRLRSIGLFNSVSCTVSYAMHPALRQWQLAFRASWILLMALGAGVLALANGHVTWDVAGLVAIALSIIGCLLTLGPRLECADNLFGRHRRLVGCGAPFIRALRAIALQRHPISVSRDKGMVSVGRHEPSSSP